MLVKCFQYLRTNEVSRSEINYYIMPSLNLYVSTIYVLGKYDVFNMLK